jgi:hypothetical protein
MLDIDLTGLRKQLVTNGYHPLPNKGKIPAIKGWNTADFLKREMSRTETWPDRFDAPSTGVRIEDGLGVIDIDVDDPLVDRLLEEITLLSSAVGQLAPTRFGGGQWKLALFVRVEGERFVRIASKKFNGHCVEIFGGAPLKNGHCSRQFGVSGPHSFDDNGEVRAEYVWADGPPKLVETPVRALPAITRAMAFDICRVFEELAQEAGWKAEVKQTVEQDDVAYDIDETTRFNTNRGGIDLNYAELCEAFAAYGSELRCSTSFIAGRGDTRDDHCSIGDQNRHHCVAVYVHGDAVLHFPKSVATAAPIAAPSRPDAAATLAVKTQWLLANYGYCALTDSIVELLKAGHDCELRPLAFMRLYRSWREPIPGRLPGAAIRFGYATGAWEVSPSRQDIEAVRMRPDKAYPLYQENGRLYKNTFLKPQHEGEGQMLSWMLFMQHLIPDEEERLWFCDWLAHKQQYPGIPGVAVIMVAATDDGPVYGAGRGLLRDILARLFGAHYVKPLDFDVFTGQSAQGVYTDWGAHSILVTVTEAKDTTDSGKWASRRAVYERLKEIVDPRAIDRTFMVKGRSAFTAKSFASYLIFSNHRDALQVVAGDRRVTALANGRPAPAKMAAAITEWMENPGNIAELARWLEARDLTGFNVYAPLMTKTKMIMQELAGNEFDEVFAVARRVVGPRGLFTGRQLEGFMLAELNDSSDVAKRQVKRMVRQASKKVNDYRLAPREGRDWILCWRDHNPVHVDDVTMAQNAVLGTGKRLADSRSGGFGQVLDFSKKE